MKKILSLVIAVIMLSSLCVGAYATSGTDSALDSTESVESVESATNSRPLIPGPTVINCAEQHFTALATKENIDLLNLEDKKVGVEDLNLNTTEPMLYYKIYDLIENPDTAAVYWRFSVFAKKKVVYIFSVKHANGVATVDSERAVTHEGVEDYNKIIKDMEGTYYAYDFKSRGYYIAEGEKNEPYLISYDNKYIVPPPSEFIYPEDGTEHVNLSDNVYYFNDVKQTMLKGGVPIQVPADPYDMFKGLTPVYTGGSKSGVSPLIIGIGIFMLVLAVATGGYIAYSKRKTL